MDVDGNKILRETAGLLLIFLFLFSCLSLGTYSAQDPGFNQQLGPEQGIANRAGLVGAYFASLFVDLFGLGAWGLPLLLLWLALGSFVLRCRPYWFRWLGAGLVFVCVLTAAEQAWQELAFQAGDIRGGGYLGSWLLGLGKGYLHLWGAFLLWLFCLLLGLLLCFRQGLLEQQNLPGLHLGQVFRPGVWAWEGILHLLPDKGSVPASGQKKQSAPQPRAADKQRKAAGRKQSSGSRPDAETSASKRAPAVQASPRTLQDLDYPVPDLLDNPLREFDYSQQADLEEISEKLSASLLQFGIQGEVVEVRPGPVVTMLEFRPAPGIKISRIANLHDDLALALKAVAVRIEAPIPGKDLVGIEIPNKKRRTVYFREIIESDSFQKTRVKLPMALGQDIQGSPRVEDLVRMPHLLVAGATGTGKSVGLNSILISLLFKSSPQELKLLLIDPKRIEMGSYADLPHLVHPVVTEMDLAKVALEWAVKEMDRRYEAMSELGVRNLEGYNQKYQELLLKDPETVEGLQYLPYLVIVIDELADLMLTAGKEAEASIVRLAQLARAAGIHLILATQRPSVDVVTGLIKANFPARIAFQVSSKHDSRTILDTVGAQYLLGQGDMLFKSSAGKLQRLHGAFISDQEINSVIEFWKQKHAFSPEVDLQQLRQENGAGSSSLGNGEDIANDPMYDQALDFVLEQGKASISMLQRQLRVGFNRAARYVEQMEKDGIIGPQEGSKPRHVIKG
ncbi:MAG: DNA translocase FtsK 4TM domain-containing protein [Desulfohalobiaceae bacterium]